jgi:hypothetical protein
MPENWDPYAQVNNVLEPQSVWVTSLSVSGQTTELSETLLNQIAGKDRGNVSASVGIASLSLAGQRGGALVSQ